jgi:GDP-L-fucose synthase
VLHCAIKGGHRLQEDSWNVMDSNLQMYYNLLDYKSSYNKLIHFGSGADMQYDTNPYGMSKKVIAKSISDIDNFYNIRMFGVFDENELDTRFIKSNINRYLNKQPIEIHNDKLMDFFYMKDLILLVDHFMTTNEPYKSSIDCTYPVSLKLSDIANIINALGAHRVSININETNRLESYVGGFNDIVLPYVGLEQGIKETYIKLKEQHEIN